MSFSSETTSSGYVANRNGNKLEQFVCQQLFGEGYIQFEDHRKQLFINRSLVGGKQFAREVFVGNNIYETNRNVDFLIMNKGIFPEGLIIECKWQQSSGSVDEKYPFMLCNIIETGVPTIVLLDGKGYKPGAEKWLRKQAVDSPVLCGVYCMSEFNAIVNEGFFIKPTKYFKNWC